MKADRLARFTGDLLETIETVRESGARFHLNFELKRVTGDWKISDYAIDSESTMKNYSSHLKSIFEKNGADSLMTYLRKERARLDADLGASHPVGGETGK